MSVLDKLKLYSRKPVAVIMAATLATSSVPVQAVVQATPAYAAPQQKAGGQASGELNTDAGTITLTYDDHAWHGGEGECTITKDDILTMLKSQKASELASLFAYTPSGTNQISQAIDAMLTELAGADEKNGTFAVTQQDGAYLVNWNVTDIDVDVAAADDSVLEVEENRREGEWTVSADEGADENLVITVNSISYEYQFNYTHTYQEEVEPDPDPEPEPGEGEQPGEGETPGEGEQPGEGETPGGTEPEEPTFEEKTETAWYPSESKYESAALEQPGLPAPTVAVTASSFYNEEKYTFIASSAESGALTYQDTKEIQVLENRAYLWAVPTLNGEEFTEYETDTFKLTYEDGVFTVKALAAGEGETLEIGWEYLNGDTICDFGTSNPKITTLTISEIAPKAIEEFGLTEQPFRLQAAQEDKILEDANEQVRTAIKNTTGDEVKKDYYASASLGDDFNNQGEANQTATVELTVNKENADAFANYTVTDPTKVTIKAIQDVAWADSGLALASEHNEASDAIDLTADNADTWVKKIPTASWDGYELAYATSTVPTTADEFASSVVLSGGDGIHSVTMYALSSDNVVSQITGVSYKLDTLAPQLNGADVDYDVKHGTFVFGDQRVGVSFSLVDLIKANADDSKDKLEALQSGVNTGSVTAEYDDGKNGATLAADLTNDGSEYSFSITGDRDVNTSDIHIHASDVAGNVLDTTADDNNGIPTNITKLVAESTGPSMSVSWDSSDATNGKYYNHNRTLTVTITEAFFNYTQQYANDQVIFTVERNGETAMAIHPTDFTHVSGDTYSYTLAFTDDADYVVSSMHVEDIVGHAATGEGDTFTIDKTAPTMQVTFDNNNVANGNYYNAARTATITITEHNFDPNLVNITTTASAGNGGEVGQPAVSGWSSSGDTHTATVTFPGQGVYTLAVDGMDLATNELTPYTCPEFVVDTIEPEITISGVENLTAYADAVSPGVAVHDTNLSDATDIHVEVVGVSPYGESANPFSVAPAFTATDANVEWGNPDEAKPNDNVYTVVVQAVDLAGNTSDEAVTFSVNRFGSTYVISDETGKMIDQYLKHDNTTDVRVTEINPSGLDESKTSVELTRDTSNTTLKADEDYTTDEGTETGWSQYVYTVDRDNYDADGVYRVLFHSQDVAGNISENAMKDKNAEEAGATAEVNFAVDDTAPLASFADLSNAEPYNESSHTAKVTFEDNLMLDHAVVEIDGQEVATFDAEQLANSTTQEFTINESTGERSIKVTVWDAAGNEGEASMDKVVVTTNAFELWRRNTPLFAGTLAVAAVAVAGIAFGIVKKRKKDDEETNA